MIFLILLWGMVDFTVFFIKAAYIILWNLTIWPFRVLGHLLFK